MAGSRLRLTFCNPFCWPWVRRGSERLLNDFAEYFKPFGSPSVLASAPEPKTETRNGIPYRLLKQRFTWSSRRQWNTCHAFAVQSIATFKNNNDDIVHCLSYFDAFAAVFARMLFGKKYKVVFHAVGIPTKKYFRAVPFDNLAFRVAIKYSDAVITISHFAKNSLQQDFAVESHMLSPPVDVQRFTAYQYTEHSPYLLFVGDLTEPRKGASLMCQAFCRLADAYPDLELKLSGRTDKQTQARLTEALPESLLSRIHFLGTGDVEDLPQLYGNALATILPSVWEAFGLVLVESLASGTPVIGTTHGGIPDVVGPTEPSGDILCSKSGIGYLFEPQMYNDVATNIDGLTAAIALALKEEKTQASRSACRKRAAEFSLTQIGSKLEDLYEKLLEQGSLECV